MRKNICLDGKGDSSLIFAACFAAYMASYIGRTDFSAALPAMLSSGFLTKAQGGLIGSSFFFVYGAFQVINGILSDRFSPFLMISAGTLLSALANAAMPLCPNSSVMAVVWGFNGFALSLLWAAVLRILAGMIREDMRAKACLHISATLPFGTVVAYLCASLSEKFLNWHAVFRICALFLFLAALFFIFSYLKVRPHFSALQTAEPEAAKAPKNQKLLPLLASSGILLILPADAIHGAIKEGITTWTPTLLTEVYSAPASLSTFVSIALPLFNITGAYLITPLYKKVFGKSEYKAGVFTLLFSAVPLGLLLFMKSMPLLLGVLLLALVTTAMYAYNYLVITLLPMRFAAIGRTATVTGLLNATAYAGCACSGYGFGVVSVSRGWNGMVVLCLILTFIAAAVTFICRLQERKRNTDECL